jgi:ribosome-binding factor A
MKSRRFARKPPPPDLCAQAHTDDGIDPRFWPKHSRGKVSNRKALQLCRQVERALSVAVEGDVLRELTVQSVAPAPDSSRLLVTFVYHGVESTSMHDVLAAIESHRAKLRCAVALAINRKKTPELVYHVVPAAVRA